MTAVKTVPLGDVATVERSSVQPADIQPGTMYVGLEDIESGGGILSARPVDPGDLASAKFSFTESHVLYGKLRPYLAKIAAPDFAGICSTDIVPVLPGPFIDRRYLLHFLRQPTMIAFASARSVGINLPRLSPSVLETFPVPLPPLPEQRRITAILDQADELQAKRRNATSYLDAVTQSIFRDLFRDRDASNWKPLSLPACYWFQEGPGVRNWQFTDRGVKLLNVGNIEKNGSLNLGKTTKYLAEEEAYGKYKHFLVDPGDLVIASSGISFDQDGMLRTRGAFVSLGDLPLCMNTSTIRFKAIEGVSDLRFLWVWLGSAEFRSQITRRVTGTAQQNFGPSHLKALTITLPPLSIQEEFAKKVEAVEQLRSTQLEQRTELEALFAALQYRAFRGEL